MKKGDGYYLDEFGHTHSEDYLAVTVRYVAEGQLSTLVLTSRQETKQRDCIFSADLFFVVEKS